MASWLDEFWKNLWSNPLWFVNPQSVNSAAQSTNNNVKVQHILDNAIGDPTGAQGQLALEGLQLTPEQEAYLNNLISQQQTAKDNEFQEHMRDTSYLSAGSQLAQLGLSPSGVLQTGGAFSGVTSAAAQTFKSSVAMERYQKRMELAKQLLSMTSSMASAGVYGSAYLAAKKASSVLSSQAAHSARLVTQYDGNNNRIGRTLSETLPEDFDYSSLLRY